ncbi:MAG: leucine--tRNA ligase [Chitinophagaceae bacterium]|nr:leucine--tRNA ligase [Chitinophagaceae bacterium]
MEYNFRDIEKKWQKQWKDSNAYKVENDFSKPKYYVLDMFPYPSGAGLHVGHPLGYIASDIFSRYKRLKGYNVLHPMGFDSFGLPAEQYALDTGQHPAETTKKNIATFKAQLDNIGFCYDWSREVQTSDPNYYKWTQWIFLQLFNSYFCNTEKKARPIAELIKKYETKGAMPKNGNPIPGKHFTADEWNGYSKQQQEEILMNRRLAFSKFGEVNWCEALGTVLANDEVVNGVSERGGHPVEKKKMRQWYLRITAYADRLLEGLETVDFSDSMKEMQRNWIGKSTGAEISFQIKKGKSENEVSQLAAHSSQLVVYTTRPDTIFGVDFMVVAPEHELVTEITTTDQKEEIEKYLHYVKSRSDRERQADVKQITGCFTGAYAINPFDGRQIPIWIAEYVLAGYGTGAIMAVPCGDQRDYAFAKHFNIPITNIIGEHYTGEEANATKEATLSNSGFLNGMLMKDAIDVAVNKIEELGIGKRKVNYKMRDAGFSRQRYWGEPFPIKWIDGIAHPLDESELPLTLPHVDKYGPGPDGQGPLANIQDWLQQPVKLSKSSESKVPSFGGDLGEVGGTLETSTMPGYAGSSWYFLRYMDPQNEQAFCERKVSDYWNQVDLYIGGTEHAVGHLLYSRMWTKVLYDLNLIGYDEPYKKLVNQGMIQGSSRFIYRLSLKLAEEMKGTDSLDILVYPSIYLSQKHYKVIEELGQDATKVANYVNTLIPNFYDISFVKDSTSVHLNVIHVDVNIVDGIELDVDAFKMQREEYRYAEFLLEDDKYICGSEVEKMSKSKFNTVNPDELVAKYGADTFRMYEMFLGPVEMSKPWDTKGIEGVHRFLKKFWRLFFRETKAPPAEVPKHSEGKERSSGEAFIVTDEEPTPAELKVLHNTIKKIEQDTERFSFNTGVSGFMIATNELTDLKCHKRKILEPLLILLAPYAPHIAEELYELIDSSKASPCGGGLEGASYPKFEEKYVKESSKAYPVAINGKTRTELTIALDANQQQVEALVMGNEIVQKWLEGKAPKKIIYVKNKMINVVI